MGEHDTADIGLVVTVASCCTEGIFCKRTLYSIATVHSSHLQTLDLSPEALQARSICLQQEGFRLSHACRAPESPKIAAMYSSGASKSFTASSPAAHMAQLSAAAAAADRHTETAGPSPASVHYTSLTQFQNKVELYRGRSALQLVACLWAAISRKRAPGYGGLALVATPVLGHCPAHSALAFNCRYQVEFMSITHSRLRCNGSVDKLEAGSW